MKKLEVYDATSTPSKTLTSIAVSGLPDKMEYYVGEDFECKGLTVTGTYNDKSTSTITSGITWTATPEAFTEASESASVSVTAKVGEIESNPFVINGIVVNDKPADKYFPVAWNEIENGGKYFITAANNGEEFYFAARVFAAGKATAITFDAALAPEADMWTFTKSGDVWKISEAEGAGLYVTATNNGIVCALNKGADFTVAQGSSAEFTKLTASDGENNRDICLYNQQDFRCYSSTSSSGIHDLKLYGLKKEGVVAKPVFSPGTTDFDGSIEVTLTAEDGAYIYYTLDGSTPDGESGTYYEAPFTLTETTTVKAIARKDGKDSEIAEKTYKKIPSFASLAELLEKLPAQDASVKVSVTLTDIPIESFYVTSGGKKNGVYTNVNGTTVELYEYDVPETWQVGGTLSGKIIGDWLSYYGTPELQKWEGGWNILKYTPPRTHDVTITAAGYATAYIPFNATVSGATAYYVTVEGTSAKLNEITGTIPANTGIVLKGEEGTAKFTESAETPATVTGNLLVGTTADGGQTFGETADTKYYILSKVDEKVGFYWDNTTNNEGTSAKCAQYKAVLAVPKSAGIKSFYLFDDEATGILKVNESAKQQDYKLYNLNGQVVGSDYEGIVIVNGKKMLNK